MLFLLLLYPQNRALTIVPNRALDRYRAIRYREDDFQVIFRFLVGILFLPRTTLYMYIPRYCPKE